MYPWTPSGKRELMRHHLRVMHAEDDALLDMYGLAVQQWLTQYAELSEADWNEPDSLLMLSWVLLVGGLYVHRSFDALNTQS